MDTLINSLIGTRFTNDFQPYGPYTILIEQVELKVMEPSYGYAPLGPTIYFNISGPVIEGSETSYLWGATSTRDITGKRRQVRGVSTNEMLKRHKITVAM